MVFRIVALWFLLAFAAHAEPINVNDITVVDGDTIDFQGSRYRMVGYDTPEISSRWREVSAGEKGLAVIAKERFTELLKSGRLDLTEVRCACSASNIGTNNCNYGRKCAILSVNGKNIGETLIAEELALPFVCSPTRCPRMPDWPGVIERIDKR